MSYTILKLSDAWSYTAEADNLLHVAVELRERGHRVVLACKPITPLARKAREAGVEVELVKGFRPGMNVFRGAGAWSAVARLVKRLSPDIVHAYRSPVHALALGARWLASASVPLVRTRANSEAPSAHLLNRWLYDRYTERTIVAADIVRRMLKEAGFQDERTVIIRGAVDISRFDPDSIQGEVVRRELGIPLDAKVIGCVARLAPIKGHRYLVEAMGQLPENTWLMLVGPPWPDVPEEVADIAQRVGIADRFIWTKGRPDVERMISCFDVGVVASVGSEALSRATLEYMAMRVPVVATRVGGIPEILNGSQAGMLVEPASADALAHALNTLLADRDRRREMGAAGREEVESEYTIGRQVDRLETLYADILN